MRDAWNVWRCMNRLQYTDTDTAYTIYSIYRFWIPVLLLLTHSRLLAVWTVALKKNCLYESIIVNRADSKPRRSFYIFNLLLFHFNDDIPIRWIWIVHDMCAASMNPDEKIWVRMLGKLDNWRYRMLVDRGRKENEKILNSGVFSCTLHGRRNNKCYNRGCNAVHYDWEVDILLSSIRSVLAAWSWRDWSIENRYLFSNLSFIYLFMNR